MMIGRILSLLSPSTILAFIVLFCLGSCSRESDRALPSAVPVVRVRAPHSVDRQAILAVSGSLKAASTVHLAFQVPGQLVAVSVSEGQRVTSGEQLARLDDAELNNSLRIAEARLREVSRKHERLAELYKRGSLTLSDMDKVDAALAESRVSAEILRKRVKQTVLVSPVNGIIARKNMEPGAVVALGQPVVDVVEVDRVVAEVSISESDVVNVRAGQKATLQVPALPGRIFESTLAELLPVANELTRSYTARIYLNNDDGMLRPGSIVFASIVLDRQQQILTIPGEAVLNTSDGSQYVYVLAEDWKSVRRKQITADRFYRQEVIVSCGIDKNDLVVIGGQNRLSDGTVVRMEQGRGLL